MFVLILVILAISLGLMLISAFGGSMPQVNLAWLSLAFLILAFLIEFATGSHIGVGHG